MMKPNRLIWRKVETATAAEVISAKKEKFSPLANELRGVFIDGTHGIIKDFFGEMEGDSPIAGFGDRSDVMGSNRMELHQQDIKKAFKGLIAQIRDNFDRTLEREDSVYREELAEAKKEKDEGKRLQKIRELDGKYESRYTVLADVYEKEMLSLKDDVEGMGRQAEDASEFRRVYLPQLRQMSVKQEARTYDQVEEALGLSENSDPLKYVPIDVEYTNDSYGRAYGIIEKIQADEKLVDDDYQEILTQLSPFFDNQIDSSDENKAQRAMTGVEHSGALMTVHAMSPIQRMELGETLAADSGREPYEKRQGLLFMASANYLTTSQVEHIMRDHADLNALNPDEKEKIETAQRMFVELQEEAKERILHSTKGNLIGDHFTASNGLIYEVIGRIAGIGMLLTIGMNIKDLPSLATDPVFLGMAATVGLSYDHITGGIGKGGISAAVARAQIDEPIEEEPDESEALSHLMSDSPEVVEFLREDTGKMLALIDAAAEDKTDGENSKYDFKFDDLIDEMVKKEQGADDWTDQEISEKTEALKSEHIRELDGKDLIRTQLAITKVYQHLTREMGLGEIGDMLEAFDKADEYLGLKETKPITT
jgi:hypothetical protein